MGLVLRPGGIWGGCLDSQTMKGSPVATSSARGGGGTARGKRASSLLAQNHGQRPTPTSREPGGLAAASPSWSPSLGGEGGPGRKADFSGKERKLPGSSIMGRGLGPSPTTTGIHGEATAEGRKRPLPAPLPGGGGHRVGTPERSHSLCKAPNV